MINLRLLASALLTSFLTVYSSSLLSKPLPQYDGLKHEGAASCASSTCHGSAFPRSATNVLQNEYVTWSRHDTHANAYKTLLTEESKIIAANLGLPNAHEAKICLDCHAHNVPKENRGERFQISDGISCEACHGGAENYLASHTANATHEDNVTNGLYPTDEPFARAKLCLSCHLGDTNKFATHEIMGAGHPRLSFELDTFSILQPMHFVIDEDYSKRKNSHKSIDIWIRGQVEAGLATLEQIELRLFLDDSLFPEIALFDCHSCHHNMSDKRWSMEKGNGQPPGAVRVADGNFKMLLAIATGIAPEKTKLLNNLLAELRSSVHDKPRLVNALKQLKHELADLKAQLSTTKGGLLAREQLNTMVEELLNQGISGQYRDYIAAEQSIMAIDVLLSSTGNKEQHKRLINRIYNTLADEERFDFLQLERQFTQLKAKLF